MCNGSEVEIRAGLECLSLSNGGEGELSTVNPDQIRRAMRQYPWHAPQIMSAAMYLMINANRPADETVLNIRGLLDLYVKESEGQLRKAA